MATVPGLGVYWLPMKDARGRRDAADRREAAGVGDGAGRRTLLLLLLILLLTIAARVRLLDIPLERDEGGFAYVAALLLEGIPPYVEAYDYKPPALYLTYAATIGLLGSTPAAVHAGLLAANLAAIVCCFLLVRRWRDDAAALLAAGLYALLSLSPSVLGFAAHGTQFVAAWVLAGALLLERALGAGSRARISVASLAAGAAFGLAALHKQSGLLFLPYALILPFAVRAGGGGGIRSAAATAAAVAAGFLLPVALAAAWLGAAGALDEFLHWTLEYPALVASGSTMTGIVPRLLRNGLQAGGSFLPLWIAGGIGLLLLARRSGGSPLRARVVLFGVASFAAVAAGYETRSHYFVQALPVLSMGAGIAAVRAVEGARRPVARLLPAAVLCLLAAAGILSERRYFFTEAPAALSREIYRPNLFADAGAVADAVRSATASGDRVAVLGSEPEILFLSGRRSATPWIFMNFFAEAHGRGFRMQEEAAAGLDSALPAAVVLVNQPFSWGAMPRAEWPLVRWAGTRLAEGYERVWSLPGETGVPAGPWGEESVVVFRRRAEGR